MNKLENIEIFNDVNLFMLSNELKNTVVYCNINIYDFNP
jgi:hypothetical protein